MFTRLEMTDLTVKTLEEVVRLSKLKGGEYSGDQDALANFTRNAKNLETLPELVWAVYAGKHWDALMQFIKDKQKGVKRDRLESIDGRILDLITYLCLFRGMLIEDGRQKIKGMGAQEPLNIPNDLPILKPIDD